MNMVLVEWDDAYSSGGWHVARSGVDRVSVCTTVGLLIEETNQRLTIAQNFSSTSGNIADTINIPKGCIKRIRILKLKDERAKP